MKSAFFLTVLAIFFVFSFSCSGCGKKGSVDPAPEGPGEVPEDQPPVPIDRDACFSPDGKILAGGGLGDSLHLWEIPSGQLLKTLTAHKIVVSGAQYTPDGKNFVSIGSESLKIWNPKNWELLKTVQFTTKYPRPYLISPDSKIIAVGFDYKAQIWNISDGQLLETIEVKPKGVDSLCFSPDSKMLLMGAADKKIRIWKLD